jgi:hypothetical protein
LKKGGERTAQPAFFLERPMGSAGVPPAIRSIAAPLRHPPDLLIPMTVLLETRHLIKHFRGVKAVNGIDLALPAFFF